MSDAATTTPPDDDPLAEPLWSTQQVCDVLGLGRKTIYRLVAAGRLDPIKISDRTYRYRPADVRAFVRGEA